jgi:hypothetical protein
MFRRSLRDKNNVDVFIAISTSNNLFEEPATPIIPEPSSVIKAILSICEIPFIGFSLLLTLI